MGSINYYQYIQSIEWRMKATAAKTRAEWRCQACNRPDHLEAHHRTYERLGHERDADITVLCDVCHEMYTKSGRMRPYKDYGDDFTAQLLAYDDSPLTVNPYETEEHDSIRRDYIQTLELKRTHRAAWLKEGNQ